MYNDHKHCSYFKEQLSNLLVDEPASKKGHNQKYDTAESIDDESKPDLRTEKIELVKERIKMGFYFKKHILSAIADNMIKEQGWDHCRGDRG